MNFRHEWKHRHIHVIRLRCQSPVTIEEPEAIHSHSPRLLRGNPNIRAVEAIKASSNAVIAFDAKLQQLSMPEVVKIVLVFVAKIFEKSGKHGCDVPFGPLPVWVSAPVWPTNGLLIDRRDVWRHMGFLAVLQKVVCQNRKAVLNVPTTTEHVVTQKGQASGHEGLPHS